jgi:hypothetical protein
VAHACNPSYSGGGEQEEVHSQLGQIVNETPFQPMAGHSRVHLSSQQHRKHKIGGWMSP